MRWTIFALSIGAAVTSIVHGVFILLSSLSGVPSTDVLPIWRASMPLASVVPAMIGGLLAFNRSRWGAVFFALGTALCSFAPREIWAYGGIYLFCALLCFFLRSSPDRYDYDYDYDDAEDYEGEDEEAEDEEDERDYEAAFERSRLRGAKHEAKPAASIEPTGKEGHKVRRRTSKTCPTCGATVAIEHRFCPNCGASLHIPVQVQEHREETVVPESDLTMEAEPVEKVQAVSPSEAVGPEGPDLEAERSAPEAGALRTASRPLAVDRDERDEYEDEDALYEQVEPLPPHKVIVRPIREESGLPRRPIDLDVEPDVAYHEFSQYARRRKRRRSSAGRRVLGFLLLMFIVGGTLWFLLGLRKLPPDDLPPLVQPNLIIESEKKSEDVPVVQPVTPVKDLTSILSSFSPDLSLKRGVTTGTDVNLREDHSTSSKSLTRLSVNTVVSITGTWEGQAGKFKGTWYRIRSGEREGWIFGRYLQPLGGPLPTGYAAAFIMAFGGDRAALTQKLGQPTRNTDAVMEWTGVSAGFSGDEVTHLKVSAKRDLPNKLRVGMSQEALFKAMGYPTSLSQRQIQYREGGKASLTFQLGKDGLVQSIAVDTDR